MLDIPAPISALQTFDVECNVSHYTYLLARCMQCENAIDEVYFPLNKELHIYTILQLLCKQ